MSAIPIGLEEVLGPHGFRAKGIVGECVYVRGLASSDVELRVQTGRPGTGPSTVSVIAANPSGKRCTYPLIVKPGREFARRLLAVVDQLERAYGRVGAVTCPTCGGDMGVHVGCRDKEPGFRCRLKGCRGTRALDEIVPEEESRLALLRRLGGGETPSCRCSARMVARVRGDGVRILGCERFPFCGWTCSMDGQDWRKWSGGDYWEDGRWFRDSDPRVKDGRWRRIRNPGEDWVALAEAGFHRRTAAHHMIHAREHEDLDALVWSSILWIRKGGGPATLEIAVGMFLDGRISKRTFTHPSMTGWARVVLEMTQALARKAAEARATRCPACGGRVGVWQSGEGGEPYLYCAERVTCPGMPMSDDDLWAAALPHGSMMRRGAGGCE